jgi:hypothetical protein
MFSFVVSVGALLAGLARPVTPEEYRQVIGRQVLRHESMSKEVRDYYLAKGQVLACLLHRGMTPLRGPPGPGRRAERLGPGRRHLVGHLLPARAAG